MKVCFLITGILRQFHANLYPFLDALEGKIEYDIFLHTTKNDKDSKYLNFHSDDTISSIIKNKKIKLALFDDLTLPTTTHHLSQREKNTFLQWLRIKEVVSKLNTESYDWIIRIRPDVQFHCTPDSFIESLVSMNKNYIYIPMGNDIFDSKYLKPSSIQPINDQIIFLPPSFAFILTEIYESLFHYLEQKPIISEYILSTYFHERKINVKRIHLPYTLILSPSRIIAVSGDSASGKSTLVSAIQNVFPFDSNLLLETDRYHKWERQNPIWNTLTHLHPEANNLEKLLNDTYQLKIGNDIFMVDYDHECGRFTNSKLIESKPVILLCGLHTFYDDKLRNTSDLKIFVNTEDKLKTFWKIQRDLQKRNYSKEEILQKIKKRENDFIQHILPQKEFADIIIHYTSESVPDDISIELNESQFCMKVEIKNNLLAYVYHSLFPFTSSIHSNERNTAMIFCIKPNIQRQEIPLQEENIEAGYLGIIQLLILRIFYTSFHGS